MREAWTDERLDDLNVRVDGIDRRMDEGFREMRVEFRAVRSDLSGQIAGLNRTMVQLAGGMFATMVVGFAGLILTGA